jgi:hypothetical protein
MQNRPRINVRTRKPRPTSSFSPHPKQWTSTAGPESKGSQNAQKNYERYLALAQAEVRADNVIGAENYYQHAEHYFRTMSAERGEV